MPVHSVSVVVPVYQGATTLPDLLMEIAPLVAGAQTPGTLNWRVSEVLLVHDHGPDDSAEVMRELAAEHDFVRLVWLSRNFGQHAATLAGLASSGGEWVATIDEDGQQNPFDIGILLDEAMRTGASVVYAAPITSAPHGFLRNFASRGAKVATRVLTGNREAIKFNSFRLMLGEAARSVAAYAGSGVYLDVALGWVTPPAATAAVHLRDDVRPSGYSWRSLMSHFRRLVLSSGTRGLRMVSALGAAFGIAGVLLAGVFVVQRLQDASGLPVGWTSLVTIVLISTGAILFVLGVIAEYVGTAVNMALGRPAYLIVSDTRRGPLGRHRDADAS